jgi:hypothetical protein
VSQGPSPTSSISRAQAHALPVARGPTARHRLQGAPHVPPVR